MYTIHTDIEFVAPFLYNRPADERGTGRKKTEKEYLAEAKDRVHRNAASLIIPAWNLKVSLTAGCKKTFRGKQSITDLVEAMVYPEDAHFEVNEPDDMHVCWGRIPPKTGALNKVYRPMMHAGRKITVTFQVVDDRVSPEKLKEGWQQTGVLVGLGSWRPQYGRFVVRSWELV